MSIRYFEPVTTPDPPKNFAVTFMGFGFEKEVTKKETPPRCLFDFYRFENLIVLS
jgi:hypothetical protein